jgi:2-hydroxychromene-2-carboxylate isomerase
MADLEFFWDPVCPWAWLTSRWVVNVTEERPMDVDWRFISLRIVNKDRDYATEFRPGYERGHTRGLELLRVAAAVRESLGREAVLPLYTVLGRVIHHEQAADAFDDPSGIQAVLEELGYPVALGAAATSTDHDDLIATETQEALDRCGGNVGTPVLSFAPPEGPSFFGPVINKAPRGQAAIDLWDAVVALGSNPHFSELKRSTRGRPDFGI